MTEEKKIIPIGADHAGFEMKKEIIDYLQNKGHTIIDKGTYGPESVDYPDFGHSVAMEVLKSEGTQGILLCGSGNGIAMSANKHKGIRAALCWSKEIAEMARRHNDANILVLPARYISTEAALQCVDAFFTTEFEGGRHAARVSKIDSDK